MRKYIAIVGLFAAIAITTTGFAGQRVDSGPPEIVSLHKAFVNADFLTVSYEALQPYEPLVPQGMEAPTSETPTVGSSAPLKVFADIPPLFALDKVGWQYAELKLVYDFNHWKEQIKPLLSARPQPKLPSYPLLT